MPNFLENLFTHLQRNADRVVLREIYGENLAAVTGGELLQRVQQVRAALCRFDLQRGDRCAILGANSIRWIAIDLALMAENIVVVPLYSRQAPAELVSVIQDCEPRMLIVGETSLGEVVTQAWPDKDAMRTPNCVSFDELLPEKESRAVPLAPPSSRSDADLVTIVYTSGTSGEPKGVCLNTGNISFMLARTTDRLAQLMIGVSQPDNVFHYLPLNFAASWIAVLSFMSRKSIVTLSTDLNRLADEIRTTAPHYFLNVPTLLERVRRGVDDAMAKRPPMIRSLFAKSRDAWQRQQANRSRGLDALWLVLGRRLIFNKIKQRFGTNLRALICGSAPLAPETQQFFLMLGVPVLQVYGLTETTGICTMDDPRVPAEPAHVGPSIDGIQMKIGDQEEIIVRGPHIFPGYWNRQEETARALEGGWFHTGDQGEKNARGNWRIVGRIKNLIILNSGHNIAPEPIEDKIAQLLPGGQHVIVVGNGRGYLGVLVTGSVEPDAVQAALDETNRDLPHYRQIRNFTVLRETLTPEGGLLTTMGKLRRAAINTRFAAEINSLYDNARHEGGRNSAAARGISA